MAADVPATEDNLLLLKISGIAVLGRKPKSTGS